MSGALALYLVMTGVIYVVLVAPPGEPWWSLDLYWPQLLHHRVAPMFAALDWLLATRTVRGRWWRPVAWLGYPAAFLVFSWVRGGLDGWYVYDFLDPTLDGGWPAALATTAQVLARVPPRRGTTSPRRQCTRGVRGAVPFARTPLIR